MSKTFDFAEQHPTRMNAVFDAVALADCLYVSPIKVTSIEDMLAIGFKGNEDEYLIQTVEYLAHWLLRIDSDFFELSKVEQQQVFLTYVKTRLCDDVFCIKNNAQSEADVAASDYMVGFLIDGLYYALANKPTGESSLLVGQRSLTGVLNRRPQRKLKEIDNSDMTIRSLYVKSILNEVALDACRQNITERV